MEICVLSQDESRLAKAARTLAILVPVTLFLPIGFQTVAAALGVLILLIDKPGLFKNRVLHPFYVFAAVAAVTSLLSPSHLRGVLKLKSFIWDVLLMFALGLYLGIFYENVKKALTWIVLLACSLFLIAFLFKLHLSGVVNRNGLLTGFFTNRITFAGVAAVTLPFLVFPPMNERDLPAFIAACVLVACMGFNATRTYYLVIPLFLLYSFLFRPARAERLKLVLLAAIFTVTILSGKLPRQRLRTLRSYKSEKNIVARVEVWKVAIRTFLNYPLTGIGYEMWPEYAEECIEKYGSARLKKLFFGYNRARVCLSEHVHSDYLQMLLNGGIFLLAVFIWMFAHFSRNLGRAGSFCGLGIILVFLTAGIFDYNFGDAEIAHAFFFLLGVLLTGCVKDSPASPPYRPNGDVLTKSGL